MSSLERLLYPGGLTAAGPGSQQEPRDASASAGWEGKALGTEGTGLHTQPEVCTGTQTNTQACSRST